MRRTVLLLVAGVLLAGCSDEADRPAADRPPTDVQITVDADGRGGEPAATRRARCAAADTSRLCAALRRLPEAAFDPVAPGTVCTEIYGGPDRAWIQGRIEGRAVSASLSRRNGCEIGRWEAAAPVLRLVG